jgi:hypothetical protein
MYLRSQCDRYEAKILEYGGIELFMAGIGPDGHIAFSEWLVCSTPVGCVRCHPLTRHAASQMSRAAA